MSSSGDRAADAGQQERHLADFAPRATSAPARRALSGAGASRALVAGLRNPDTRHLWYLLALVVALDAAIVGPLVGRASLHLLDYGDYPVGPHPLFSPAAYGFPPGITSRAPVEALLYWLFQGISWAPIQLLPFVAVAPLACTGFTRIFPGQVFAVGAATVLFTVNPFVYERMASGQVYVVMGYSMLPLLMALVARPLASIVATAALGGIVFALQVAMSVHYLFVSGLLLVIVTITHVVCRRARAVRAGAGIAGCGAVLSLYWLIPAIQAYGTMRSPVSALDLSVFQTLGDRALGLAANVAGMYGFWRSGPHLVKNALSGWPFLLLAMLTVGVIGFRAMWVRDRSAGRALALSCGAIAVVAWLLAMGAQGPTGSVYLWFFDHLPGFKIMREPEKFSALLALAYSAGFGAGAAALIKLLARDSSKAVCVCCLAAIPLAYGYTELWGFTGYARPAAYPVGWAAADRSMRRGETAIALPWRAYLQVPGVGSGNGVIANPLQGYFARPVISADDLEAGSIATESSDPRSRYIEFCLSEGSRYSEFGRLMAPLGVRYIILAKVPGGGEYRWLQRQRDLRRVFDSKAMVVYKNEEAVRDVYAPTQRITLRDWGQVLGLAQHVPLTDYLIKVQHAQPGRLRVPAFTMSHDPNEPTPIKTTDRSPVSEAVALPRATRTVVTSYPAYAGWTLTGFGASSQFGVTVAFTKPAGTGHAERVIAAYGPWQLVKTCDVAGGCFLAVDVIVLTAALIRWRRRRRPVADA